MTQSDQSDMRQLTIDGGEVPHPPPKPRVTCPDCEKLITTITGGYLRQHQDGYGMQCPGSGGRVWEA